MPLEIFEILKDKNLEFVVFPNSYVWNILEIQGRCGLGQIILRSK